MKSFGEGLTGWLAAVERTINSTVDMERLGRLPADVSKQMLQPLAGVLDDAAESLVGRRVEYDTGEMTATGTIETFDVHDASPVTGIFGLSSSVSSDLTMAVSDVMWGERSADRVVVHAEGLHFVPGTVTELRIPRVDIDAEFSPATIRRWLEQLGSPIQLVRLNDGTLTVRLKVSRASVELEGAPVVGGDRLMLQVTDGRVLGRGVPLPTSFDLFAGVATGVSEQFVLTGASVQDGRLVVRATTHHVREPIRLQGISDALRGEGRLMLHRPDAEPPS